MRRDIKLNEEASIQSFEGVSMFEMHPGFNKKFAAVSDERKCHDQWINVIESIRNTRD